MLLVRLWRLALACLAAVAQDEDAVCEFTRCAWGDEPLEIRARATVEYELVTPGGEVVARNTDEPTLRAVRREIERVR